MKSVVSKIQKARRGNVEPSRYAAQCTPATLARRHFTAPRLPINPWAAFRGVPYRGDYVRDHCIRSPAGSNPAGYGVKKASSGTLTRRHGSGQHVAGRGECDESHRVSLCSNTHQPASIKRWEDTQKIGLGILIQLRRMRLSASHASGSPQRTNLALPRKSGGRIERGASGKSAFGFAWHQATTFTFQSLGARCAGGSFVNTGCAA